MSIKKYEAGNFVGAHDIRIETNIVDESNVYAEGGAGQNCSTVWFNSVPACRAFLRKNGMPSGRDSGLCKECRCRYTIFDLEYEKFNDFACSEYKDNLTLEAEEILKEVPVLGRKNIEVEALEKALKVEIPFGESMLNKIVRKSLNEKSYYFKK